MATLSVLRPGLLRSNSILLGYLLLFGGAVPACSEPEHAPLLHNSVNATGGASSLAGGGDAGSGADAGAAVLPVGRFDPAEVYLLGTFTGGPGATVVSHWSTPNHYSAGFPIGFPLNWTQLLDGQLYYLASVGLRQFVPDLDSSAATLDYPRNYVENDPLYDTPPCSGTLSGTTVIAGATHFLAGPAADLIYSCPDDGHWYEAGELVYDGDKVPVALGINHLAIAGIADGVPPYGVMNLDDGVFIRVAALGKLPTAIRSSADGFHVAVEVNGVTTLLNVHADGSTNELGAYAAPNGYTNLYGGKLTPDDMLYQIVKDDSGDVILRRALDGTTEVVYSEESKPNTQVEPGYAWLVTGP